jgi:DeoR/GlpR family transcriptional regulator of sugar metabolism
MQQSLAPFERQNAILQFVERQQRVSISQICSRFSISVATARRDLETLEGDGKLERIHGGAVAIRNAPPEPPLSLRAVAQADEKRRIGSRAAQLIEAGETVFLGSGTTVVEVAYHLRSHTRLNVITNSLLVINTLVGIEGITLIGLGGVLRASEMSFIGHLTEQGLTEFRVDKVVMGIRALDVHEGLTNDYLPETQTDRAILKASRQVILVADHTKCGRVAPIFLAPITTIHTFITDDKTPIEFTTALSERGVQVLVC